MKRTANLLPRLLFGIMAALLARGVAAAQQEQVVTFDPNNTKVDFTLGDVLHTVHGVFKLKSGSIRFDPGTGAASGALVVDATSGDSGSKSRDKVMHRSILESAQYPEIIFVPQKVVGGLAAQGPSQINVEGVFRMHGSDHPLTITVAVSVNGDQIAANTQFVLPYQNWGLKNPSTFILRVSDKVQIGIAANGHIAKAQPTAGK